MMMSPDAGLLSARASAVWIAALCVVLVFHCGHLIRMHGERRWYHCAHVVMLLGMLYMYASVAFGLDLFPAHVWLTIYVATSSGDHHLDLGALQTAARVRPFVDRGLGSAGSHDLHVGADEQLAALG